LIRDATIRNSVIRSEVRIGRDVVIEDSIVLDSCTIGDGVRIRRAIIDRHNTIAPGTQIGYDPRADAANYTVTDSGLVVVPLAPLERRRPRFGS
jgi:glucose-1-phosphate adenylyltransferase